MQKTIDELHPFSRYTIELVAVVRQGNRNSALKRELEVNIRSEKKGCKQFCHQVISPQEPPTLKVSDLELVEHEATKLVFSWTPIPLEDPRVLLDQARCEQFQSRLGFLNPSLYMKTSHSIKTRSTTLQDDGCVRGCYCP